MDFIINHSGFFLGISITMLLALIGYYADKKDFSKKKNTDNSSKSTALDGLPNDSVNNNDVENNKVEESFPQNGKFINFVNVDSNTIINEDNSSDNVQNNVSSVDGFSNDVQNGVINNMSDVYDNSISGTNSFEQDNTLVEQANNVSSIDSSGDNFSSADQEVTEQGNSISFGANDFEDINMSLEDLEKKNYNEMINRNGINDSDNYYYSDLGEPVSEDNVSVQSASSELNNMVDSGVVNEDSDNSIYESINHEANNEIQTDSLDSVVGDTSDVSHEFDNEVQSEVVVEESNNVSDNIDSVPEIFNDENKEMQNGSSDDEQSVTDGPVVGSLDNSSDDDIWKF